MKTLPKIILFGCGKMGQAYVEVFKAMPMDFEVVGNSSEGAARFGEKNDIKVTPGGWCRWIEAHSQSSELAVVALPVRELAPCTEALVKAGFRRILLEKPGGLNAGEIRHLGALAEQSGADIRIAYNRRFYVASEAAMAAIREDDGALSFHFEFTEIPDRVVANVKDVATLGAWYLANSTHVVDLAFYLGGEPLEQSGYVAGGTAWYSQGSRFVGHGRAAGGALFTYHANWDCPGSWRLEIATRRRKLIFKPIERLSVQSPGEFSDNLMELDYTIDERFKPGLFRQVEAFLKGTEALRILPTAQAHAARIDGLLAPLSAERV